MVGIERFKPALIVLACVAFPVGAKATKSLITHVKESQSLGRALHCAERVACKLEPRLRRVTLDATRLYAYSPGRPGRKLWSVQVSDERGNYLGDTVWDADTSDLRSASWDVHSVPVPDAGQLSTREVREVARLRILQVDEGMMGATIWTSRKPRKSGAVWVVWCEAESKRYRVKLDAITGELVAVERRDRTG